MNTNLLSGPAKWAALGAGALLSLVNGTLYAWSIFVLPLEQLTGWSRSQTSLIFTLIIVFFSLGMASGGFILSRLGPRLTALAGGGMLAAGLVCSARATGIGQLYLAYGVMAGYGIGMANIVPSAVCLRWFPRRSGLICGALALALAAGTFVFGTLAAGRLIAASGVRPALNVLGMLILACTCSAAPFLKYPPPTRAKDAPGPALGPRAMLADARFWSIWVWALCIQIGGLTIAGHMVPYATANGVPATVAALAVGVYALGNGAGRLLFGAVFDRWGGRAAMAGASLTAATGLLALAVAPRLAGAMGLFLAAGVVAMAYGGTVPLFSALIVRFFGARFLHANIGFSATSLMIAALLGPSLGGAAVRATGGYLPAILIAAFAALPGLLGVRALFRTPDDALTGAFSTAQAPDASRPGRNVRKPDFPRP